MLGIEGYVDRSYLPWKSGREYRDRKMAKWQGMFLSEHTAALKEFHDDLGYEHYPPEQMDADQIGQNLLDAYQSKKRVEVALNLIADNKFIKLDGIVEGYGETVIYLDSGSIQIDMIRSVNFIK